MLFPSGMNKNHPISTFARGWLAAAALACSAPAAAAEPATDPVILVATPALRDRLYGASILIVKPVGNGQHMGFIVNRPTRMTLGRRPW